MNRLSIRAAVALAVLSLLCPAIAGAVGTARVGFGTGWKPQERDGGGRTFHWMGSTAKLLVYGAPGAKLRLDLQATSLIRARTVTFRYGGRIRTVRAQPRWRWTNVTLMVPAGPRPSTIRVEASPPAQSAFPADRKDHRILAVAVSHVHVAPAS